MSDRKELVQSIFEKHASQQDPQLPTTKLMSREDFFACITLDPKWTTTTTTTNNTNNTSSSDKPLLDAIFKIADRSNRNTLTLADFIAFDDMFRRPDSEFELAFRLFDTEGKGTINFENFKRAVPLILNSSTNNNNNNSNNNSSSSSTPTTFDFSSQWVQMYFAGGKREISYKEFTQLLKGFQEERLRQAFITATNKPHNEVSPGSISGQDFAKIEESTFGHRLSPEILEKLPTLGHVYKASNVNFALFAAFNNLLTNLDSVGRIITHAIQETGATAITKEDFLSSAQFITRFDQITPLEVDILFYLCESKGDGRLTKEDFTKILPVQKSPLIRPATTKIEVNTQPVVANESGFVRAYIENFLLGSVAGAIGATFVFPIDLVKTRMQNQRGIIVGELLYKNSLDCFSKVVKNEGILGLYRGLVPQLIGVAPEKAIKLAMNDLCRSIFKDDKGHVALPYEIISGGCAGASQVIFTNPLEIVKIRLQVAGEMLKGIPEGAVAPPKPTAISIVRSLGFIGLYKGVSACLLRDVPFSMIYFPAYAHAKAYLAKDGKNEAHTLLLAGALAGIPAASLVTPADVIKTRLQVAARKGEMTYDGIVDCAKKIWATEGPRAFWKGTMARVFRSSPQFGVTLFSYEMLSKFLHPEVAAKSQATASPSTDFHTEHSTSLWKTFNGVHNKFGLWLPSFSIPKN